MSFPIAALVTAAVLGHDVASWGLFGSSVRQGLAGWNPVHLLYEGSPPKPEPIIVNEIAPNVERLPAPPFDVFDFGVRDATADICRHKTVLMGPDGYTPHEFFRKASEFKLIGHRNWQDASCNSPPNPFRDGVAHID